MIKFCICDDDATFSEHLKNFLIKNIHLEITIDVFLSPFELLEFINNYDVIFLDYELPYMNGIEILNKIQKLPIIKIMVSNHNHICFDTYEYKLFWFVRKNNLHFDLSKLIPILEKELHNLKIKQLNILSGNKYINIDLSKINYIETQSNYLVIYTDFQTFKIRSSFNAILNQLDNLMFIIPIYGVIINIAYIEFKNFHDSTVLMKNGKIISISRSKKKGVKDTYARYCNRF